MLVQGCLSQIKELAFESEGYVTATYSLDANLDTYSSSLTVNDKYSSFIYNFTKADIKQTSPIMETTFYCSEIENYKHCLNYLQSYGRNSHEITATLDLYQTDKLVQQDVYSTTILKDKNLEVLWWILGIGVIFLTIIILGVCLGSKQNNRQSKCHNHK